MPLVSVGLPIRNAEHTIEGVVTSVLAQDVGDLELVIGDNASDDGTEEICRALARADQRIAYHRRPANIGIVGNFEAVLHAARGTYFRWIGDDDWLDPGYLSRCLERFAADPRLVLVSTQLRYTLADGTTTTAPYSGTALGSADPADRFAEMLRLLTAGFAVLDPLYSVLRRTVVAAAGHPRVIRGDELLAARLALAGPWDHVPEVLGGRSWATTRLATVTRKLDVPRHQAPLATPIQCRELLRAVAQARLDSGQARRARAAVYRLAGRRATIAAGRAGRRGVRVLTGGRMGRPDGARSVVTDRV